MIPLQRRAVAAFQWLRRIDPGMHRCIKGLRLVMAYACASMLRTVTDIARDLPERTALPPLAPGFALWASVSEARATRTKSNRDLLLLVAAVALAAAVSAILPRVFIGEGETALSALSAPLSFLGGARPELSMAILSCRSVRGRRSEFRSIGKILWKRRIRPILALRFVAASGSGTMIAARMAVLLPP